MKKISLFILTLLMVLNAQAQVARPKLIVGLVVDQMRWDYLYFYQNEYGQGGLRRLLNEHANKLCSYCNSHRTLVCFHRFRTGIAWYLRQQFLARRPVCVL